MFSGAYVVGGIMLRIYNTLTRKKEIFNPIDPGNVGIYVCGVTVYDSCHVGHARSMVVFDVIVRYLRFSGYSVRYIRNFTDVDDKIIRRANSDGTDIDTISDRYIKEFHVDMDALGVERASVEPRATDHIDAIIDVIGKLMAKEHAYEKSGDVFFAVDTIKEYGKLSGRKLEDMEAGARVEVDRRKRNPMDFALWKSAKPGEPFWESPWGKGRPGWHIECSAMSARYLGPHFDIHGGGKDLIFPHHENEIAQSEGAFEVPFANYWIHNGFVNINHEKMSKSLGNFLTIEDILKQFHPEAVRLFLLSNHYRSPVDFSNEAVSETEKGLHRMYALLERIAEFAQAQSGSGTSVSRNAFEEISQFTAGLAGRFKENMDDDFNTARVVGLLFDAVHRLNRFMDELSGPASREINDLLLSGKEAIVGIGRILGILTLDPREFFGKKQDKTLMSAQIDEAAVKKLIAERTAARKNKDWARADEIRDLLAAMDIVIEDRHDKTVWKVR
jgi:cysteinyl-tRNA synthetase